MQVGALALAAFASVAAAKPPAPSQGYDDFPGCRWGQVKGAKLSIWSFACGPAQGGAHLAADDKLPGFVLVERGPDGPSRRPVIRAFRKAAAAPIQSILPLIRTASPGRHAAACVLRRTAPVQAHSGPIYALEPTGAARAAWEASQITSTEPDMPCGSLGVGYVGDRYFQVLPGDPSTVVFVDMGSEVQIFDPRTLAATRNRKP